MNHAPDPNQLVPPHLQDSELISHLDGELSRADRERVASHLECCWDCRNRLTTLQASIDKLIAFRRTLRMPTEYGTDEMRVEQFRNRLARHAGATQQQENWFKKVLNLFSDGFGSSLVWVTRYRQPALAVVVAVCLLVTMFTDVWTPRVSAETILVRVQEYEFSHQPADGMVLRTSLRVDRIETKTARFRQLEQLTILRETPSGPAVVQTQGTPATQLLLDAEYRPDLLPQALGVTPKFALPLVQYLAGVHWIPDLAPAEFRKILAGRGVDANSARKVGSLFELHYPFAAGHASTIGEAIFVVDARDYAPVRMSLMTTEAGSPVEYRFTRAEYSVEPRTAQITLLLSSRDALSRRESGTAQRLAAQRVVPLTYLNSTASDNEVAVVRALHGTDACLGEEVHVFPMSDGSLLVQGLVDSAQRREAVRRALKSVPGQLAIEIYLPRELKSGTQLFNPPDRLPGRETADERAPVTTLADISSQKIPLHDVLYRHFSNDGKSAEETERQINAFSNDVVTLARQTFLHAWALKRLDREFSTKRAVALTPGALNQIEEMRQDHRRWIASISQRQTQTLGAIVDSAATASLNAEDTAKLDTDMLLRLAQEQSDLVRALFTTSSPQAQPLTSVTRLLSVLKRMGT